MVRLIRDLARSLVQSLYADHALFGFGDLGRRLRHSPDLRQGWRRLLVSGRVVCELCQLTKAMGSRFGILLPAA